MKLLNSAKTVTLSIWYIQSDSDFKCKIQKQNQYWNQQYFIFPRVEIWSETSPLSVLMLNLELIQPWLGFTLTTMVIVGQHPEQQLIQKY